MKAPLERAKAKQSELEKETATLDKDQMALKNARGFFKDI